MAKLNTCVLLTAILTPASIKREIIFAFSRQQWYSNESQSNFMCTLARLLKMQM